MPGFDRTGLQPVQSKLTPNMQITEKIRRALKLEGDQQPPVSLAEFESKLWVLRPVGNPENAFINTCNKIGLRDINGVRLTFDVLVQRYAQHVQHWKSKGGEKFITGIENWMFNSKFNEVLNAPNERNQRLYPYLK